MKAPAVKFKIRRGIRIASRRRLRVWLKQAERVINPVLEEKTDDVRRYLRDVSTYGYAEMRV